MGGTARFGMQAKALCVDTAHGGPRDAGRFRDRPPGWSRAAPASSWRRVRPARTASRSPSSGATGNSSPPSRTPAGCSCAVTPSASMSSCGADSATRYITARCDPEAPRPRSTAAWRPSLPVIRGRAGQYARLMRLDRPVGIFLLLWPTPWALWIAGAGRPDRGWSWWSWRDGEGCLRAFRRSPLAGGRGVRGDLGRFSLATVTRASGPRASC